MSHMTGRIRTMLWGGLFAMWACTCFSLSDAELLEDSANWPPRIRLTDAIELDDGKSLKSASSALLIRAENGMLLLDFGRYGVHFVDPAATDFGTQALELSQKSAGVVRGNYIAMFGPRIVVNQAGELERAPDDWSASIDYLLLTYIGPDAFADESLLATLSDIDLKVLEDGKRLRVIVAPQPDEDNSSDYALSAATGLYFIPPPFAIGYTHSMAHLEDSDQLPLFILIDKNGKVYERFDSSGLMNFVAKSATQPVEE